MLGLPGSICGRHCFWNSKFCLQEVCLCFLIEICALTFLRFARDFSQCLYLTVLVFSRLHRPLGKTFVSQADSFLSHPICKPHQDSQVVSCLQNLKSISSICFSFNGGKYITTCSFSFKWCSSIPQINGKILPVEQLHKSFMTGFITYYHISSSIQPEHSALTLPAFQVCSPWFQNIIDQHDVLEYPENKPLTKREGGWHWGGDLIFISKYISLKEGFSVMPSYGD